MSDFTGAAGPSDASQSLKSRFMPYFKTTEQCSSFPLRFVGARAGIPQQQIRGGIGANHAGDIGGIDDHGSLALQNLDGLGHDLGLRRVESATRLAFARDRDRVVVERPRDADARALQPVGVQETAVAAPGRRRAGASRRIVGIRRSAFENAQQNRRVGDGFRERPGRILIRRDRNHAVAADAAHRRLDARQHVLVRRAQDGARRFRADIRRP